MPFILLYGQHENLVSDWNEKNDDNCVPLHDGIPSLFCVISILETNIQIPFQFSLVRIEFLDQNHRWYFQ